MDIIWQIVLLVGGAVLGVVVTRLSDKWFSPLGEELWVDYSATSLTMAHAQVLAPEVTYRVGDRELAQPYRTRVFVWRVGTKDVRGDAFSDDLVLRLGVPVIESTLQSNELVSEAKVAFDVTDDDATITIAPSLVRPDFVAEYQFISDGLPKIQAHSPVADVKVTSFYSESRNRNRVGPVLATVGGVLLAGGLVTTITLAVVSKVSADQSVAGPLVFTLPGMFLGILLLAAASEISPRRARMARRALRSRIGRGALDGPQVESYPGP